MKNIKDRAFIMPMRDEKIICANNKLIDHLKVPQNKQATNTPGIPWNLPSTSITKYGKI